MVYLALQEMALASPNYSTPSFTTPATHSNYPSLTSTPSSSATSLPLSPLCPKPTQAYPGTTDHPYINSIKLETIEPQTFNSSQSGPSTPDNVVKKVPRPPNSFIIYRREHSAHYSKITAAELSKILGEQWAHEPPERKAHYADLAKAAEKEHALKYPEYKFTPAKRGTGRRAKTIRAAVSAALKVPLVVESPKACTHKPSPLSALAPTMFSSSSLSPSASPHLGMHSLHSSQGYVALNSGAFPYTTTKNNTQGLAHLARPSDLEDFHLHLHHKSSRSGPHRPKTRLIGGPLRPRLGTPATPTSPYGHAVTPGSFDLGCFPSLNFGFPHLLPQSPGVPSSSPLSSPGTASSSLLFDPVVPTKWQWTPPMPATPATPTFSMPVMCPSHLQSQSVSPMPLIQDLTHHNANIPGLDYFTLHDSGRPAPFAMSWGSMNPMSPLTPLTPETPSPYSEGTTATSGSSDGAPASYQWGVGAVAPVSPWQSHDVLYSPELRAPISPEFRAPMSIPVPSAKHHHFHNYHHSQAMSPLNQAATATLMMAEQDMSISPVLSSCSSSYGSMYSLNERHARLPPSFLAGDLDVDSIVATTTTATPTSVVAGGGSSIAHLSLSELEHQKSNAKLTAAASQFKSPSPIACTTFL
ncbi:hypothetical protein BGW39_007904 [Mortierella sp. 14UC]|nr:hypothetical protein BGW39_007904 [Mortierella sp. 14UC]